MSLSFQGGVGSHTGMFAVLPVLWKIIRFIIVVSVPISTVTLRANKSFGDKYYKNQAVS